MKHKRTKAIITLSLIIMAMIMSIIPSYAINYVPDTIVFTLIDENNERTMYTFTLENEYIIDSLSIIYNTDNYLKCIIESSDFTGTKTIWSSMFGKNSYFYINSYCSGDDGVDGYIGNLSTGVESTYEFIPSVDSSHSTIYITISIFTPYGYTQEQYDNYGLYMQRQMETYIQSNPNAYGLYSAEQRQAYGNQQFLVGKRIGLSDASVDAQAAYDQGLQDGVKKAETAKDLLNVGLSGIYNAFLTFTQQSGIFGVSLLAILTSGVIIFIIYIIIKAVRG